MQVPRTLRDEHDGRRGGADRAVTALEGRPGSAGWTERRARRLVLQARHQRRLQRPPGHRATRRRRFRLSRRAFAFVYRRPC